jgi:prepilin-type N-terminal cleavage/methylation domain-containing protein
MTVQPHSARRPQGFTLIELIVAMGIFIVLAAIAVSFVPKSVEKQKAGRGASQLQGWLLVAKQLAKRNNRPTGLRLLPGTLYPNTASAKVGWRHDLVYIEQPADFTFTGSHLGASYDATLSPPQYTATTPVNPLTPGQQADVDFWGGYGAGGAGPVLPGDILQFGNGGTNGSQTFYIGVVNSKPAGGTIGNQLILTNPTGSSLTPGTPAIPVTMNWRIIRAPRAKPGEAPLRLPDNIAVDLTTNGNYGYTLPAAALVGGNLDIVFSPSGAVTGWTGSPADKIHLWVKDIGADTGTVEEVIITVYVRTGLIGANPVVAGSTNPYSFSQDGRSSGM